MLETLLQIVLHIDTFIIEQVRVWGPWMYALLFLIIFCETGLVVTPFLPGDSLLFAAGAVAARSDRPLDVWVLFVSLSVAAVVGDTVNYWIGKRIGPKVLKNPNSRIFRKEYLDKTHHYFERYGGKTIILARFVPIVRTFAPFLAGVGEMHYTRFLTFNVVGGIVWVVVFLFSGFWFGRIPVVEKNLTLVLIAFVVVTTIPILWEGFRSRQEAKREEAERAAAAEAGAKAE